MSKIANVIIGLTLFSMFIFGVAEYINGYRDNYDVTIQEGWENVYLHEENITSYKGNMTDILESKDTNWVVGGVQLGYAALKTTLGLPIYVTRIFSAITYDLGIPNWVTSYIFDIVAIILVFVLVAALVRWYI